MAGDPGRLNDLRALIDTVIGAANAAVTYLYQDLIVVIGGNRTLFHVKMLGSLENKGFHHTVFHILHLLLKRSSGGWTNRTAGCQNACPGSCTRCDPYRVTFLLSSATSSSHRCLALP